MIIVNSDTMETILNSMCRCCASEGVYKDVKTSYTWMGEEEVYADMLREIFNVNVSSISHFAVEVGRKT